MPVIDAAKLTGIARRVFAAAGTLRTLKTKVVTAGTPRAARFGSRDMIMKRVVLCSASSMFCASDTSP